MRHLPVRHPPLHCSIAALCAGFFCAAVAASGAPPRANAPRAHPADVRIQVAPLPALPNPTPLRHADPQAPLGIVNHGFATDQDIPGSLAPVIADLHSPIPRQRDAATQELMRLPPVRLDDIANAIARQTDPEAIARLSNVAIHLYLKPRTMLARPSLLGVWYQQDSVSLLGISFEVQLVKLHPADAEPTPMTAVVSIEPGFPVAQSLFVGDRIFAINGKRFDPDLVKTNFPDIVRQFPPGATLTLSILRDGKTLEVPVEMGALPVPPVDLNTAVEARHAAARAFLQTLKTGRKDMPTLGSASPLD